MIETLHALKEERQNLLDTFEGMFSEITKLFEDTYGTTAQVSFFSDPLEKYSLLTKKENETYTYKITYGFGKLARKWQLIVSTEDSDPRPLTDAPISIRLAFLQVHKDLLEAITTNLKNDNEQIKRFLDQYEKEKV